MSPSPGHSACSRAPLTQRHAQHSPLRAHRHPVGGAERRGGTRLVVALEQQAGEFGGGTEDGREGIRAGGALHDAVGQEAGRSEEHTSELQSRSDLVCRLLLEKKKHASKSSVEILNFYVADSQVYADQWFQLLKDGVDGMQVATVRTDGLINYVGLLGTLNRDS